MEETTLKDKASLAINEILAALDEIESSGMALLFPSVDIDKMRGSLNDLVSELSDHVHSPALAWSIGALSSNGKTSYIIGFGRKHRYNQKLVAAEDGKLHLIFSSQASHPNEISSFDDYSCTCMSYIMNNHGARRYCKHIDQLLVEQEMVRFGAGNFIIEDAGRFGEKPPFNEIRCH